MIKRPRKSSSCKFLSPDQSPLGTWLSLWLPMYNASSAVELRKLVGESDVSTLPLMSRTFNLVNAVKISARDIRSEVRCLTTRRKHTLRAGESDRSGKTQTRK